MTAIRNASLRSALRREYEAARRAGRDTTYAELLRRAVHSPVSQGYFIGVDHAIDMIRLHRGGRMPGHMSAMRRQMWDEIAAKVDDRCVSTGCNTTEAIAHVLSSATASRFFVSDTCARHITLAQRKEMCG